MLNYVLGCNATQYDKLIDVQNVSAVSEIVVVMVLRMMTI
jgi:hypothetical protein